MTCLVGRRLPGLLVGYDAAHLWIHGKPHWSEMTWLTSGYGVPYWLETDDATHLWIWRASLVGDDKAHW